MEGKKEANALTGALIGLSRATYGDTKPDGGTWRVMADALVALGGETAEEALRTLTDRVREEKKRLVPRCSRCASPCGRNDDYDMALLGAAPAEVRALKTAILSVMADLAAKAADSPEIGEEEGRFCAKALFAVGEDWGPDLLRPILEEAEARQKA